MKTDKDKIEDALDAADMEAEGANYHDRVGLARNVFDAVKPLVPESDHVKLAKKIGKAVSYGI